MATQRAIDRCDECGGRRRITPLVQASPWEFTAACEKCKREWVISWAHCEPPPTFEGEPQMEMF